MIDARAAVLLEAGADPSLTDIAVRPPIGDEVLVRIDAVGICHTDISIAARWPAKRLPMVFGHEGAGTVVATGPQADLRTGQPVVLTFASCGRCEYCAAHRPAYCAHSTDRNMRGDGAGESSALRLAGTPIGGGFFGQSSLATYAVARQRNTVAIDDLDPVLAAPLGCSVQTGVGTVLNALAARPEHAVVVFGAGAVGLSAVMGARIAGCRAIVAVDPVAQRRELAAELGATATVDAAAGAVAAEVLDATGGGAHAAVDTTAIPEVLTTALSVLRARGTLAIVGLGAPVAPLPVGLIMGRGLTVRGVVEGDSEPHAFIPRLVALAGAGELPLDRLVTTYAFEDFDVAWSAAKTGRVIKPVLVTGS
ncbi:NAD(P)-dependent alcohol dehydrogenase [Mycolicibacterium litorale]|uniref:Aryl-alcohol dehydrogenase n=1 Tax=Mycolicibacterium litorale TaxID=758802 RepID=A0AAD1IP58_9MYCO|nr:NAD(P)-dependent alcohol dehydrogenase [Mycolicibacterium litorale]MCV7415874.1 NAD(P)-dependent alcohol dehydrogenase [Mycolicibacterium litorale]TDY09126.1 aryl-alcohol dehydrogenase [Mycolicibacterium litorale]BBY17062.1 aryl-alcohol dehydrogenase [Mycolicibacterium litorale]